MISQGVIGTCFGLAALPLAMHTVNWCSYRKPKQAGRNGQGLVSILIPARNEEANIKEALDAAGRSRGVKFEILVVDDQSEDRTGNIVQEFARNDPRVKLLRGEGLPLGWCGKQHACWRLAQAAEGDHLLFVDADVRLTHDCAAQLRDHLTRTKMSLVSGVPQQVTRTFWECLLVPMIHYVLLGFLPMFRMRRTSKPGYAAGCGQLFMAKAADYREVGGHAAIRRSLHDGISLPRAFRRAGFKTDLVDATDLASCRMFESAGQVWRGLSRNAIEGLAAPRLIVPATLVLVGGQILPWLLLPFLSQATPHQAVLIVCAVLMSLTPRCVNAKLYHQSWLGAMLHPLGVLTLVCLQWGALFRYLSSKPALWRGRSYTTADSVPLLQADQSKTP